MSAYMKRMQTLVAALLLALGVALGFAGVQHAYADEGGDDPSASGFDIEADEYSFYAYNDYLGSDVVANIDSEADLIEALDLNLYYWDDDDNSLYLEYGTDYQVSGWYRWDNDEDDYVELDSYPMDIGEYKVKVEGIGSYTGARTAWFEIYDAYKVSRFWNLELDSWSVEYANGSLVYPDFRVYFYDDDDDVVDVDASEYTVKVMRETYDDDEESWIYKEVADGEMEPGYYYLRIVPSEESPYHGYLEEEFRVTDSSDIGRVWSLELDSWSVEYANGSLVYPDFRVYAYDDDGYEVEVDASEYDVKVMRAEYDEDDGEWYSTDEEVADGEMEAGYYGLRIVSAEGSSYHGYLQDTFRVRDNFNLSEADIDQDSYTYNAGMLPAGFGPIVRMYDYSTGDTILLKEGADYTVSVQQAFDDGEDIDWVDCKDFDGTAEGYYRFKVTGKGNYHGEGYGYGFDIVNPYDIKYADIDTLNDLVIKRGSKVAPELEVTLNEKVLTEGTDYKVTYYSVTREGDYWDYEWERVAKVTAPLSIGRYEAEITAMGSYTGTQSYYFGIYDKNDLGIGDFELNQSVYAYTGEPVKIGYTITAYDGTELVFGKDYRLWYGIWDDLAGEDDSGAIVGEVSETPPTEINDSDYDERYAVYAEGIGEYCGKSYTRVFDIVEPNNIRAAVFKFADPALAKTHEIAYTGKAVTPKFTLVIPGKNGDTTLVEGRDYTVEYREDNNWEYVDATTAVGQYTIIVNGIDYEDEDGNEVGYYGSKYFYFNIGKSLANAKVTVADQDYTGKRLNPAVTVMLDGKVVPADCYSVEYANNVDPGTATVTVTAREYDAEYEYTGYIGSAAATFKIVDKVADKAAADAAIAKINAIGKVTAKSGDAIAKARDAYNALTDDQKKLVSADVLAKLTSAESAYTKAVADEKAAQKKAASTINKATVKAADIKKASDLGATTVTLGAKVKKIAKNAFKGTKITTVVVKTTKLKKSTVKNAFKNSKVKTVKVPKAKKKAYKKIFTKKVVGKKVKVK